MSGETSHAEVATRQSVSGVVDEDVERAERLVRLCEEASDICFLRDVGMHRDVSSAVVGDLAHDAVVFEGPCH
jgi:hypothetical protein